MMADTDDKKIRVELEEIFGKIDGIIKRIETEDPGKNEPDEAGENGATEPPTDPENPTA